MLAGRQVILVATSFTSKAHKAGILAVTVMTHVGNTLRLVSDSRNTLISPSLIQVHIFQVPD